MQQVSCSVYRCHLASGLLFKSKPQTAWPKGSWRQQMVWPIYKLVQCPVMTWTLNTHVNTTWEELSWPARRSKPKNLERLKKITKPLNQNTPEDAKTDNRSLAVVTAAMNCQVPQNAGNFLIIWATISLCRTILNELGTSQTKTEQRIWKIYRGSWGRTPIVLNPGSRLQGPTAGRDVLSLPPPKKPAPFL
jgi:hypothetical protein